MPEIPEKSGSRHPEKDRREHPRQRIHSLSYVKIGDGNGGIVLNISESGISVQAAGVLDETEPITLGLEIPRVRDRIELTGEIMWLSASRKEAGVRFVDLPVSALEQIRKWMAREASPEKFEDETDPVNEEQDVPVKMAEPDSGVRELNEANIMSADELKGLASESDSMSTGLRHTPEPQDPVELKALNGTAVEAEADQESEIETEENIGDETQTETETEIRAAAAEAAAAAAAEAAAAAAVEAAAAAEEEQEQEEEKEEEVELQDGAGTEERTETKEETEAEQDTETEDDLIQSFGPPVVPFERRPHTPFSSMNAISSASRAVQNLAIASPIPHIFQPIPEPMTSPAKAEDSDWRDFRVQLQTGWFLAALVLLLALISFIAGMAVRRGALNGVMGEQEDSLVPKSAPATSANFPATNPTTGSGGNVIAPSANPLSIEIVDTANRHWVIPTSAGTNHLSAVGAAEAPGGAETGAGGNHTTTEVASSRAQTPSPPAAAPTSSTAVATAAKPGGPLVLSLPETPISASGSVAIKSQRSVPMPVEGTPLAKGGRNLQVGQLVNLVEPIYPYEAVQQRVEGTVKLHAVIGTDGAIESLGQVSGPQILVNASMVAVRNWKYSPTRMNGQAIETQEDISFVFRLPN